MDAITYLSFQGGDRFFQGCNLLLRVALLLALQSYHSLRGIGYETLVGEFLLHTSQETFEVLKLSLHLGDLCLDVDHIAQRNCKLVGTYHEGRSRCILLCHYIDGAEVTHLGNHSVEGLEVVTAHSLQFKLFLGGDVLRRTDHTYTRHDLLSLRS